MRLLAALSLALVAVVAVLVSCCVSAVSGESAPAAAATSDLPVSYFVLIDAGSTGSRAHVHQYRVDPSKTLPVVEDSMNKKIKPGLSSYAKDPPAASKSIQDLLDFIKATVPQSHWKDTPIQVHATAGLRSVTPAEAAAVLDVVRDDLAVSGFKFEPHWARVISGEQEGINGWMAVNYLLGAFDNPAPAGGDTTTPPSTGVVEMGGSSMQITFSPANPSPEEKKQLNEVTVAGHKYYLYTHSFLQYGLQAAEKLYQKLAIADIEEHGNPCYPPGFRHSSAGDFDKCSSSLAAVVDKTIACASSACSFNGVYQPRIGSEQFLAIENFYYTAKFFGNAEQKDQSGPTKRNAADATPTGNQVVDGLRRKGKEFCNQQWPSLREKYAETSVDELKAFCFSAAYQSVVLESGLGFGPEANLRVAKTIAQRGIDWEMGATLFELLPKDPAVEAQRLKEEEETIARRNSLVNDPLTGFPLAKKQQAEEHTEWICKECVLYTLLFAAVVVLAYFGYLRYHSRKSGSRPIDYSQVGQFNRV